MIYAIMHLQKTVYYLTTLTLTLLSELHCCNSTVAWLVEEWMSDTVVLY